ncbi:MAG: hypothetical protein M9907_11970 [Burkholderiaceae bacterium]|nr:hypothetical protein [Burkholderiaceae bacterium]
MLATVLQANVKMVTTNLFSGDQETYGEFVAWCAKNERAAFAKASEAVARTQSSKPMEPLLQKRISALKSEAKHEEAQRAKAERDAVADPIRKRMAAQAAEARAWREYLDSVDPYE